jgi:hypothetical protein
VDFPPAFLGCAAQRQQSPAVPVARECGDYLSRKAITANTASRIDQASCVLEHIAGGEFPDAGPIMAFLATSRRADGFMER